MSNDTEKMIRAERKWCVLPKSSLVVTDSNPASYFIADVVVPEDAHLIAASPDLFDVVRRWEDMWNRYIIPPGGGWPMVYEEHEDIRIAATAALAKARGEATNE